MSEEIRANDEQLPAPEGELVRLARRANEAHNRVADSLQQAVANALEVGETLLEAKELCEEGKFTAWLRTKFEGGLSTARGYMRLVANWNQLGGDLQRAGGLSQRQITKLLKGLPCSDGRANPRTSATNRLPAPTNTPVSAGQTSSAAPDAPAGTGDGDPLLPVEQLLEQVVAELRRLSGGGEWASYAQHVLKPLEHIHRGILERQWLWELMPT